MQIIKRRSDDGRIRCILNSLQQHGGYTVMTERAGQYTAMAVIAFVFGYLGALAALERTQPVVKVKRLELLT